MEPHAISAAFWSIAALLGLVCLVGFGYCRYRIDRLRQELFALRDSLFDYAAAGNIPFSHKSYGMLRSTINGFIRFSHVLSLTGVVAILLLDKVHGPVPGELFRTKWQRLTADLSDEVRAGMNEYMNRLHILLVTHMLGHTTLFLLVSAYRSKRAINSFYSCLTRKLDRLDTSGLAFGE